MSIRISASARPFSAIHQKNRGGYWVEAGTDGVFACAFHAPASAVRWPAGFRAFTMDEIRCFRGGAWFYTQTAGVFHLDLSDPRSDGVYSVGFRAFTINKNRGGDWTVIGHGGVFVLGLGNARSLVVYRLSFRAFQIKMHPRLPFRLAGTRWCFRARDL